MQVTAWRHLAENAAESLSRGDRVIVQGRLRQKSYESQEGEKRTSLELYADGLDGLTDNPPSSGSFLAILIMGVFRLVTGLLMLVGCMT